MKHFLFFLFILFLNVSFSQNIVLDSDSKKGLPYTNISLKNSTKGFYTNKKGEFYLKKFIHAGDTLIFSSLGYNPKEIVVGLGNKLDTVFLTKRIENLDEIVISKPKKTITKELGVLNRKNSSFLGGVIKLAVFIKNDSTQKNEGYINELIYRKLKVKNEYTICDTIGKIKCKTYKFKPKRDLAIRLQLYNINKKTFLPDINSPLLHKDIFIRLDKSKTIKYDISKYSVNMPQEGVFIFLEVLGVFNNNGEIIDPKFKNIFAYGTNRKINKQNIVTYGKFKNRPWSKKTYSNALFSIKVDYPIYK